MGNFLERVQEASRIYDMDDYVNAVQNATVDALHSADPGVFIEKTGYFNHSAIPDLWLSWGGTRLMRPLFLRNSYEEVVARDFTPAASRHQRDPRDFAFDNQVEIALSGDREQPRPSMSAYIRVLDSSSITDEGRLVTDSEAIDGLALVADRTPSPVHAIVAQNLLRRARGVVDAEDAAALGSENLDDLMAVSESVFSDQFYSDIAEIRELMEISKSRGRRDLADYAHLSTDQVVALLPWLLTESDTRRDIEFWSFIAHRMTLKDLESALDSLNGVDLTPLMTVACRIWTAARAYRGIVPPDSDFADDEDGMHDGEWRFEGRTVSTADKDALVRVASNGRSLKARNSSSSTSWQKLQPLLVGARLEQIQLDGIDRSVLLDARRSPDVKADAAEIAGSLGDTFLVRNVVIGFGARDEERLVEVLFGESLALNRGRAYVGDLVAALQALAG